MGNKNINTSHKSKPRSLPVPTKSPSSRHALQQPFSGQALNHFYWQQSLSKTICVLLSNLMIFCNWHPTLPMCATHRYPTNLPALHTREIVYLTCVCATLEFKLFALGPRWIGKVSRHEGPGLALLTANMHYPMTIFAQVCLGELPMCFHCPSLL